MGVGSACEAVLKIGFPDLWVGSEGVPRARATNEDADFMLLKHDWKRMLGFRGVRV